MNETAKKVGLFFLDIIQTVVLALSLFVISYWFLFQPHVVKGTSMVPNFHDGEFLLTSKISYRLHEPQRYDVIVFKAPPTEPCAADECEYIKRLIGMPGDQIMLLNNSLYVNGQKLPEPYLPEGLVTHEGSFLREGKTVTLGTDDYLPLGDNRPFSRDGREFGPVKRPAIIGKAWLRYWPVNKLGIINNPAQEK